MSREPYRGVPTYVVVPFKDEVEITKHVVNLCSFDPSIKQVILFDNGSKSESVKDLECWLPEITKSVEIKPISAPRKGIYEMWNNGWELALSVEPGSFNVAFLNNDISFLPHTIEAMSYGLRSRLDAMVVYPDYDRDTTEGIELVRESLKKTNGTKKDGGMCGHCFIIKGEEAREGFPMFDEQFEWWCGDDDFARRVEQYGGSQYRLVGWPCDHINEATAGNGENDWTHEAKGRDIERLKAKWGHF